MPYIVNLDQRTLAGPQDIEPSARLSLAGTLGSALEGNPTSLLADLAEVKQANQGLRLGKADADAAFKAAGVKQSAPEDGYTQAAVDILIKRRRDEQTRQRIDAATPWSWLGTPTRAAVGLLATVADPLNIASAFVPVVPEARAAAMLARAGESALSRAGARAAIGVAEGAVGSAIVEAPVYGLHSALQDDYHLTDSIINMAFGTAAGGGLHAVGGAVGDALAGGVNPYARFSGMTVPEVRKVLDLEAGRPVDVATFTPAQRRAAGLRDAEVPVAAIESSVMAQELRTPSVELARVADAPFAKLHEITIDQAQRAALGTLRDDLRAELLAQTSRLADPRVVADAKQQLQAMAGRLDLLTSEEEFKRRAKLKQAGGLSRKQAESAVRKEIAAEAADVKASSSRLQSTIDSNAAAAKAAQDLAALDRGEVPAQFAERVKAESDRVLGAGAIARAITGTAEPPAAFVIGMASPQTREVAMRAAVAHMATGRLPDVESVVRMDPTTIGPHSDAQAVKRTADKQAAPDSAYLADAAASVAAEKRIAEAPKTGAEQAAKDDLADTMKRLADLQKNLEAAGADPARVTRLGDLASFDEAVKQSDAIGRALEAAALCGLRQ